MEFYAVITVILALFFLQIEAIPLRGSIANLNSTATTTTQSFAFSNSEKLEDLVTSVKDGLIYLTQSSQRFKATLAASHLVHINSDSILLSFASLNFNSVQCSPHQLTKRIVEQQEALQKFDGPMQSILVQLSRDQSMQNLVAEFSQMRVTFERIMVAYNKLVSSFLTIASKGVSSTTSSEMTQRTREYLVQVHPTLTLSLKEIQAVRDYVFVRDLIKAANVVRSELQEQFVV
eukprot:gene6167-6878_t